MEENQNQTAGYMTSIARHVSGLSNFHTHHNASCAICEALEAKMVRVGAVIFCKDCSAIFESNDPVRKERPLYLKWLHISQGKFQE
jgi:hypothetical protein